MWYSQYDKRWAKEKLGLSQLNIAGYGCTITSIANWLSFFGIVATPHDVNQKLIEVKGFAFDKYGNQCLVIWERVQKAFPQMKHIKRVPNYNNIEVAWWIYVKKTPVLVEVAIKGGRHWVLYIGGQKLVDPLTGGVRYTSVYTPTGYSLFSKI